MLGVRISYDIRHVFKQARFSSQYIDISSMQDGRFLGADAFKCDFKGEIEVLRTPSQFLCEVFSHAATKALRLFVHNYPPLSTTSYPFIQIS